MYRLSTNRIILLTSFAFFFSFLTIPLLRIRDIQPDFLVLLAIFFLFKVDWKRAPVLAIFLGVLKDIISTRLFGIEIFSMGLTALVASYAIGKVEREDPLIQIAGAFLFALFYELLACSLYGFVQGGSLAFLHEFPRGFFRAFYTVLLMPALFYVFDRFIPHYQRIWDRMGR